MIRGTRPLCVTIELEYEDGTRTPWLLHAFDHAHTRPGSLGPISSARQSFAVGALAMQILSRIQDASLISHCLIKSAGGSP